MYGKTVTISEKCVLKNPTNDALKTEACIEYLYKLQASIEKGTPMPIMDDLRRKFDEFDCNQDES